MDKKLCASILLLLWSLPALADDNCPSYSGFRKLTKTDISQCEGSTFKQNTGKQKVPKVGFPIESHNPECGSTVKDVIYEIQWDGDGLPTPSISERGEFDEVKCKRAVVKLPPGSKICGIRYWVSNSHRNRQGKHLEESPSIRNTGKGMKFNWARKCPTLVKKSNAATEIAVVFKNWRASYDRYFQFEVEYQQD